MPRLRTKMKYKSDISEAVHSTVVALFKAGAINKATMREFDADLLVVPVMGPDEIKNIRLANKVSQPVFAYYLNTSPSTIEKWESGAKKPSGMALKLLGTVKKHGLKILA